MTFSGNSFSATYSNDPVAEAFFQSIVAGDITTLQRMLADGFDIDTPNSVGNSPLLFALVQMKPDVALYLLSANANVHLEGPNGTMPAIMAGRLGCDDVAAQVIMRGANPLAQNKSKECAMDYAGPKTVAAAWPRLSETQQNFWFLNMLENGRSTQVVQLIETEKFNLLRLDRKNLNDALGKARVSGFDDIANYTISKLSTAVAADAAHGLRQRVQLQRPILLKQKP